MLFSANLDTSLYSLPFLFWVEAALPLPATATTPLPSLHPFPPKDVSTGRRILRRKSKNQLPPHKTTPKQCTASCWVFLRSHNCTSVTSCSFTSRQPPLPPPSLTLPLRRETPPQPLCHLVSAGPSRSQCITSPRPALPR